MGPSPADLVQTLEDLGGWGAFLFLVIVIGLLLWRRGWVPGWIYQDERDRRMKAEAQLESNIRALELLAAGRGAIPFSGESHGADPHG